MRKLQFAAMLLGAAIFVGCNDDSSTPTEAPDATSSTPPAATPDTSNMPAATPDAGAKPAMPKAAEDAAKGAANATGDATAAIEAKAKELLDQGMQYAKENKMELAEGALKQLEGMKDQLPAEWTPRIEQLRSAINAAKATGGSLPSLPGGK